MSILEKLLCREEWLRFLEYKRDGGHLSKSVLEDLTAFINNQEYLTAAERINNGGLFSVPEALSVNKRFSDKKRTVYSFGREENYIQKMLAFQLLDYDYLFCDNLYSFRKNMGVKKAVKRLVYQSGIRDMYSYKLDISDYFNSVKPELLLPMLKGALKGEEGLYNLIEKMLLNPYALSDGIKVEMKKGILAGSPVSGFLANLYLSELDKFFYDRDILYARYSDDIIFFTETEAELNACIEYVKSFLFEKGLSVNEDKVCFTKPNTEWSFLGFKYSDGFIDVSDISKRKLKKKIKRKARALLRWRIKNDAQPERAVRAFIKYFNKKFYDNPVNKEITWCRWYFPIINTSDGLCEIDSYMQQCIRYIATGKFNKSGYNFRYEDMKRLGYRTLVNGYYNYKETGSY